VAEVFRALTDSVWVDLGAVAVFSLIVYYVGVHSALPRARVAEAVAVAEQEMLFEAPGQGAEGSRVAAPAAG